MTKEDLVIDCSDCPNEFMLSDEERQWYDQKGWEHPKRCPDCRNARKEAKREQGGGGTRVAANHGGGHDRRRVVYDETNLHENPWLLDDRPHYKVDCKRCKQPSFVPFVPKGPAMCQQCHHDQKA